MHGLDNSGPDRQGEALDRLRSHLEGDSAAADAELPAEPDLARRLGLDPRGLARAVDVLCAEGRLRRTPDGRLAPVCGVRRDSPLAEPESLMEARQRLEPELAGLAAMRATPADIRRLNRLSGRVMTAADLAGQEMWNSALHRQIAEAAGNRHLLAAFEALDRARRTDPGWLAASRACLDLLEGDVPLAEADHGPVVDAIASGDPEAASVSMRAHLLMVGDLLSAALPASDA